MNVLLFQRVSQSEAIIFKSNAHSTILKNTRVNGCLFTTNYQAFKKLSNLSVKGSVEVTHRFVNLWN